MHRTRTHRLTLVPVLAALTAVASSSQAQEDAASDSSQAARIIWKKAFEGGIEHRNYFGGRSEPDVGISPDTTRATPVRMVAGGEGVYILDAAGHVERIVSLRRGPWPEGRDTFHDNSLPPIEPPLISEYAMTAPTGEFYVILESLSDGHSAGISRLRAFNVDGSLRFELVGSELRQSDPPRWLATALHTSISPNSDYLVLSGDEVPFLDFYDTRTGALLRHIDYDFFLTSDFDPFGLGFSEDGTRVILTGFKTDDLLEFDARGQFLRRIKGGATSQKAKTARQTREAMKRALEPKAVKARLARGHILSGVAEFGLLRNRSRGLYARGDTLYLFELTGRESEE